MYAQRAMAVALLMSPLASAAPTFYKDVLPIFEEHCQECHRPDGTNYGGMVAPFSLMTFDEARPWAKSIARKVQAREMPPWFADKTFDGIFKNERVLTDDQIETLVRWAETGARAGAPSDAPVEPAFENHDGWMIGEPDLVVQMPEAFHVEDDVYDLYTAFAVDLNDAQLPDDRWITAFQCKPGSKFIHHFNCHLLPPGKDGYMPPKPTSPISTSISPRGAGQYIGGVSSGTDASLFPEGMGIPLPKGTRVTFDIHYHKEPGPGTGGYDQSEIGFRLTHQKPVRQLGAGPGPLFIFNINIPPNAKHYQLGPIAQTFRENTDIISLMPHMHKRGAAAKFELFYPDGTNEVILDVPSYDFEWQTVYYFKQFKRVPAGTRVEFTAWYDNTAEKAALNRFDNNKTVTFGQSSNDEMMMGFMMTAAAEDERPGD